ncbi:MAG: cytochrome b/b6 domain-containing protein [Allosphingosinicella sp.]
MAVSSASARTDAVRVWDLPLRLFHWLLVVSVALALLSAEEESVLNQWHVLSGWVAGILVVFRLIWGIVGGEHSRFASFVHLSGVGGHVRELLQGRPRPTLGHNALGALSVLLLLLLVGATVWTGIILAEDLHELLGWGLLALVGIHVAAVVLMSVLTRENLVRAMITGRKRASRHPGAREARRPGWLGTILALLVLAGTVYAVRAYDPLAFTLRSAESYEHGRGQGGDEQELSAHGEDRG